MKTGRKAVRILISAIGACLWLMAGGCHWFQRGHSPVSAPPYGPQTPLHDSTVHFVDFSYTPASPINLGDTLLFEANLNKPYGLVRLSVSLGATRRAALNDSGNVPDEIAGDGKYHGDFTWEPEFGARKDVPVELIIHWGDDAGTEIHDGPPLTVNDPDGVK